MKTRSITPVVTTDIAEDFVVCIHLNMKQLSSKQGKTNRIRT